MKIEKPNRTALVHRVKKTADKLLSPDKISIEEAEEFVERIEHAADEVIAEQLAWRSSSDRAVH